eukprot:Mrub_06584.p1 GENE.Mrub_06584~~Mrub_06584.p1  ORF type:complete len:326 (+),score=49.30 Mrub_06584:2-979(+)
MLTNLIFSFSSLKNMLPKNHKHKSNNTNNLKKVNKKYNPMIQSISQINKKVEMKLICGDTEKKNKSCYCGDDGKCDLAEITEALKDELFKGELFELLNLDERVKERITYIQFLALPYHQNQTDYKEYVKLIQKCDKDFDGFILKSEFKKCDFVSHAKQIYDNLNQISDGLDGDCEPDLESKELIELFKQNNIFDIAINKIDSGKICTDQKPNLKVEGSGDGSLNNEEFKYFMKLAVIQNLYYTHFDKECSWQEAPMGMFWYCMYDGSFEKSKLTGNEADTEQITIDVFRKNFEGDDDKLVNELFTKTDKDKSKLFIIYNYIFIFL